MKVELNKNQLICLVKGVSPNYSLFEHPLVKKCGGFQEEWYWSSNSLNILSEEELYHLFKLCFGSWE